MDIADRSFISDRVYINKFNRKEYLGVSVKTYLDYWEEWHKNTLDVKVVLFTAKDDTLATRAIQKEEDFCRNRTYEQVRDYLAIDNKAFIDTSNEVCKRLGMPLLVVNTDNDINDTLKAIEDFINN